MAGLHAPLRAHSPSLPYQPPHANFLLLTLLSLSLALFAFLLQWRGDVYPLSPSSSRSFPGIDRHLSSHSPDCSTLLPRSNSGVTAFPHFKDLAFNFDHANLNPKICITTTTSNGLDELLPWIFYHKVIGVSTFFLFVEGKAASPAVSKVLESISGVKVIYRTKELEEKQAKSRTWNETWLSNFFYKPCNNELFVKQSLNMEMAIIMARKNGMDWILHLDADELIHPAGSRGHSLRQLLHDVPQKVDTVIFPNYESIIEQDDIRDPFAEVSMFKKNYDHLSRDLYYSMYKEATRDNPNYFLTYGNGKSAARIQDHLRSNGAHRWDNYRKEPIERTMKEAAVLHYTYAKFSDLTSRRNRCHCKPRRKDLNRCFMLDFDRDAYVIASTATEEEMLRWYNKHVVWNNKTVNVKMLRKGIFERIYTPMMIIQGLRESGLFASVIASAQGSITSHNSSRSSASILLQPRKIDSGKTRFWATTKRTLKMPFNNFFERAAVPPQSPPPPFAAMDNGNLKTDTEVELN